MTPQDLTRGMHGVIEPLHAIVYFAADVHERYAELGLDPRGQGYIAGRSAPMGPVGPHLAASVFYNFNPAMFHAALPATWGRRVAGAGARRACRRDRGRSSSGSAPLPKGWQRPPSWPATPSMHVRSWGDHWQLPTPTCRYRVPPFADLFQRLAVLREYRGDGHIAALLTEQVGPVQALVLYAAWQDGISTRFLKKSRLWDDEAWAGAESTLTDRGWLDSEGLTGEGRAVRDRIESQTDDLGRQPWVALGQ